MSAGLFVGAYASAPSLVAWDAAAEASFLHGVLSLDGVRGLELPWPGRLHAHDESWLLATLPDGADLVVSAIGNTVTTLAADTAYGLASAEEAGRSRAMGDAARLRDDVARLVDAVGRARVPAVELHSAPSASHGSSEALRRSLDELVGWDWNGAEIVIEHCDTLIPGQPPQKGYLALEDELAALAGSGAGISMNWGRTAIELRGATKVAEQVARARESGLLRGLMFSGASDTDNAYGPAWEDNHPPFADVERSSLLTVPLAADALAAAGDLAWVGLKTGYRPLDAPVEDKIAVIAGQVGMLRALLPS